MHNWKQKEAERERDHHILNDEQCLCEKAVLGSLTTYFRRWQYPDLYNLPTSHSCVYFHSAPVVRRYNGVPFLELSHDPTSYFGKMYLFNSIVMFNVITMFRLWHTVTWVLVFSYVWRVMCGWIIWQHMGWCIENPDLRWSSVVVCSEFFHRGIVRDRGPSLRGQWGGGVTHMHIPP